MALFRNLLPKAWQSLFIGSFPISMVASHSEVLQRAMQVAEGAERQREAQLVQKVVTSSAKGKGGVVGLQQTLDAIREGRVQTLLIYEGLREPGFRCTTCGYISVEPMQSCSFCSGKAEQITDVVELGVGTVMRTGGDVEVLHPVQFTEGFDKIGAILRY